MRYSESTFPVAGTARWAVTARTAGGTSAFTAPMRESRIIGTFLERAEHSRPEDSPSPRPSPGGSATCQRRGGIFVRLLETTNDCLAALLLVFIKVYRLVFSPAQVFLFGGGSGCRFTPTCSQYAAEAIQRHGALTGSVLAVKRICRCHPLGGCGHDPVPVQKDGKERRC